MCRESFHVSIGPSTSSALGCVVNESMVFLESCNENEYKTRQKRTSRESFRVSIANVFVVFLESCSECGNEYKPTLRERNGHVEKASMFV